MCVTNNLPSDFDIRPARYFFLIILAVFALSFGICGGIVVWFAIEGLKHLS